ncbi:hypothetical protein DPMN_185035 [Dreissena polymorpha]|uniref:Dynein heavy chain C-terminal domain-containing protein n=1 Tax=Dreissena polymorpha TaxID=45954 RepID=A0A9D4DJN1_DREPO|nr:hypothetical protein DPMN_185028 [Dreissena polymorpha]KAH3750509.1 hypothetical protein DPMN_185035 [Dreissena polymorpha]
MSGFTFPTGFLTAVLQLSARLNNVSIDSLSWEFSVMTVDDTNITGPPKVRYWGPCHERSQYVFQFNPFPLRYVFSGICSPLESYI